MAWKATLKDFSASRLAILSTIELRNTETGESVIFDNVAGTSDQHSQMVATWIAQLDARDLALASMAVGPIIAAEPSKP